MYNWENNLVKNMFLMSGVPALESHTGTESAQRVNSSKC